MSKQIGVAFGDELRAAGIADGVGWNEAGDLLFSDSVSETQRAAVMAAYDAHNPENLDMIKQRQVAAINAAAQGVIDGYMETYPDFERLTWATQADEAHAWAAAAEEDRLPGLVPWCANAAANRKDAEGNPMPLAVFMAKVLAKVDAFKAVSSTIAGKRQGYEDAINAATTEQAVKEIVWE